MNEFALEPWLNNRHACKHTIDWCCHHQKMQFWQVTGNWCTTELIFNMVGDDDDAATVRNDNTINLERSAHNAHQETTLIYMCAFCKAISISHYNATNVQQLKWIIFGSLLLNCQDDFSFIALCFDLEPAVSQIKTVYWVNTHLYVHQEAHKNWRLLWLHDY